MGISALFVFALLGYASAAPWRCYKTETGATVCIGRPGEPCFSQPSICIPRLIPPCVGPAYVYTPPQCIPPCPAPSPPCPPCPEPCPEPCPPSPTSPCYYPYIPPCPEPCPPSPCYYPCVPQCPEPSIPPCISHCC